MKPPIQSSTGQVRPDRDWLLVVDDDAPMCELVASALANEKLEVVAALSAFDALKTLDERKSDPILIVTDVLMPGMDGLALARKLLARRPAAKIVVMSGHLSSSSWWPADLREIAFLSKPFRMGELEELVEEARAGRARES
jgi:two-component system cell cycle sensor histidine kinase/response regulator CckA